MFFDSLEWDLRRETFHSQKFHLKFLAELMFGKISSSTPHSAVNPMNLKTLVYLYQKEFSWEFLYLASNKIPNTFLLLSNNNFFLPINPKQKNNFFLKNNKILDTFHPIFRKRRKQIMTWLQISNFGKLKGEQKQIHRSNNTVINKNKNLRPFIMQHVSTTAANTKLFPYTQFLVNL